MRVEWRKVGNWKSLRIKCSFWTCVLKVCEYVCVSRCTCCLDKMHEKV